MSTELSTIPRQAILQLRRWCPIGGHHQDVEDVECLAGDCTGKARGWAHLLRKRRMLICSVCQMGFFARIDFDEHECWSAY